MTSRERVKAVFTGEIPDKVPRWCGASPEFWEKAKKETNLKDEDLRVRMGSASHDTILEETPVENVLAMMDAIEEFGKY